MARLVHYNLIEAEAWSKPAEELSFPVAPQFDLDELSASVGRVAIRTIVHAEISLGLHPRDGNECLAYVTARYRLVFESAAVPTADERREIACTIGVAEAWPLFRAHLDRVLAEMNLPPFRGWGYTVLPELLGEAGDVFADSIE